MSTDNPFAGTDNESQWQAGYDSGIASPGGIPDTPLVLDPDQGTIWSEGALAGFTDGQQQGFQAPLNPTSGEQPESIVKRICPSMRTQPAARYWRTAAVSCWLATALSGRSGWSCAARK